MYKSERWCWWWTQPCVVVWWNGIFHTGPRCVWENPLIYRSSFRLIVLPAIILCKRRQRTVVLQLTLTHHRPNSFFRHTTSFSASLFRWSTTTFSTHSHKFYTFSRKKLFMYSIKTFLRIFFLILSRHYQVQNLLRTFTIATKENALIQFAIRKYWHY